MFFLIYVVLRAHFERTKNSVCDSSSLVKIWVLSTNLLETLVHLRLFEDVSDPGRAGWAPEAEGIREISADPN